MDACGIHPLVFITDGLPMAFFGKGKTAYIDVRTALGWFEEEIKHDPGNRRYEAAIAAYRRILEKFGAGEVADE